MAESTTRVQNEDELHALQVSVHVLGGLMALGYEIGTIMKRSSTLHSDDALTIKTDDIEGMDQAFTQVLSGCCVLHHLIGALGLAAF